MLGKRYGPARVLPIMMFCFGSMTLLAASTNNFSGLFALRWFLGIAESAFLPLNIYYANGVSGWYQTLFQCLIP